VEAVRDGRGVDEVAITEPAHDELVERFQRRSSCQICVGAWSVDHADGWPGSSRWSTPRRVRSMILTHRRRPPGCPLNASCKHHQQRLSLIVWY